MIIDPTELVRLKALAEAATPGPWESTYGNVTTPSGDDVVGIEDRGNGYMSCRELVLSVADADYIAAANPQVALALIAEVERLQSQLAQVSEVACERRVQLQTQTDLRVAAEERAGRKNVARLEAKVERLKAELASARVPRVPRTPVGPFTNDQLKSRPVLLETDDAALGQLRDLVNALGNWHDFAAFNEVVRASARELSEADLDVLAEAIRRPENGALHCRYCPAGPAHPSHDEHCYWLRQSTVVAKAQGIVEALRAKKAGE